MDQNPYRAPESLARVVGVLSGSPDEPRRIAGLLRGVFFFLLVIKIYGTIPGILLGFLCLLSLVGLVALLAVNSKATQVLRQNGIPVGLLGANPSKL